MGGLLVFLGGWVVGGVYGGVWGVSGGVLGCLDVPPPCSPPRFVQYKATSLEKQHKHDLLTEPDLGVTIDLINPDTYRIDPTGAGGEGPNQGGTPPLPSFGGGGIHGEGGG